MSMDAGGLAQMTYNSSLNGNSLGVPVSSFASRGKGSHIKRLSVPQPSKLDEPNPANSVPTPRTSRSHLLAGLRTAPKQQQHHRHQPSTPATAPVGQRAINRNLDNSGFAANQNSYQPRHPQTATGASFPNHQGSNSGYGLQQSMAQMYTLPEHVLAPPMLDFEQEEYGDPMDDKFYADLVSTNLFLAAQQQRLQQQLASVTAAAQQFQGLNLGMPLGQQQVLTPATPPMGYYQQQAQQGMQPIVQPVPGQPGLYSVFNPMTGQQNLVMDNSVQLEESPSSTPYQEHFPDAFSAVDSPTLQVSPPPETDELPVRSKQSPSPPRSARSPPKEEEVAPLPPPSANAFRRGHKKGPSFASSISVDVDAPKSSGPRSSALPPTPMTGTFGPGQNRAGEHPIRQPRGPPSLEELVAKPTSKYEGSKNFVTRQRRRAVHNLVRAGIERRGDSRGSMHNGSGGSTTPSSDAEFSFSGSDGDEAGTRSGSLSTKPSIGSIRAVANGAIGSEKKEKDSQSRTRGSVDSMYATTAVSSDESQTSPTTAAIVAGRGMTAGNQGSSERRKMPMLVLSSAEKRKSPVM